MEYSNNIIESARTMRMRGSSWEEISKSLGVDKLRIENDVWRSHPMGGKGFPLLEDEVLKLYDEGLNYTQIAQAIDKRQSYVRNVCNRHGLSKQLTPTQQKVKELRLEGKLSAEIAAELGIDTKRISALAKVVGLPFTDEEKARNKKFGHTKTDSEAKARVEMLAPGFDYVGNYTGCDGRVDIRCKVCGRVSNKSMISIRSPKTKDGVVCEYCKAEQRAIAKAEKEQEAELKAELKATERELFKLRKAKQLWMEVATCEQCGEPYLYIGRRSKYCSDDCKRIAINRKHDKRINEDNTVDRDITLEKLYRRDKGRCYICGRDCDYNDFKVIEGCFVVGDTYPTIEHVKPLCKGGLHSWDNIKLACFRCNTKKGSKYEI